jgi:hypothetical protein
MTWPVGFADITPWDRAKPDGRRRLGDRLAVAAGELLAHRLPDEPAPRHDVERLGDHLADLGEPGSAAAGAGRGRRHDHPLARQMLGQRPTRRSPTPMLGNHGAGLGGRGFGGRLVLGDGLLELARLQLELLDQPGAALARPAVLLAPGHRWPAGHRSDSRRDAGQRPARGEQQPQALDLQPGAGHQRLGLEPRRTLGEDHRVRRSKVSGQGLQVAHAEERSRSVGFVTN